MDKEKLTADLKRDEGKEPRSMWNIPGLQPYMDSRGHLTIGYGRLIDPDLGGGLSEEEAEFLLENDIREKAIGELDRGLPWWRDLPESVRRGLANMCFQLGLPRLLTFKKTLGYLKFRDFEKASVECLDSRWAQQTPERALRIAELFRSAG